jgi:hypothetical protein
VAGEFSRLDYVASITLRNTRGIDILASKTDAIRSVAIQVKTRRDAGTAWVLSKNSEGAPEGKVADNLFYVFVSHNGAEAPCYHVVPRTAVVEYIRNDYAKWLASPGIKGGAHRYNAMHKFADAKGEYRDAWHLLGLDRQGPTRGAGTERERDVEPDALFRLDARLVGRPLYQ